MIRQLVLQNWMCYRGSHELNLESKAYAVVARYDSDSGRSNRGGKSALLEAVKFVLTGRLNKDRRFDSDGWISKGAKDGSVSVLLDDDMRITRSRTRGSSTKLKVEWKTDGEWKIATQDDAQKILDRRLGFDLDDYETVAYFPQGAMSRLIRTEPEKVFDVIRGWLGLAKAEEAESLLASRVKTYVREMQQKKMRLKMLEEARDQMSFPSDEEIKKTVSEITATRQAIQAKKQEQFKLRRVEALRSTIEEFEDAVRVGKELSSELSAFPSDLKERLTTLEVETKRLNGKLAIASSTVEAKRVVASGHFDGMCPVAKIACPATTRINADREAGAKALEEATQEKKKIQRAYDASNTEFRELTERARELRRKTERRNELREKIAETRDDVIEARKELKDIDPNADEDAIEDELRVLHEKLEKLTHSIAVTQTKASEKKRYDNEIAELKTAVDAVAKIVATTTKAKAVMRAAQRRIAERAIDAIGSRANDMLRHVDLKLDVSWEREGKGLAKTCEMCGTAFPSSTKVKECEACGCERGQHVVQKIEFDLSERSGAADDWGGISLQLSAGSWLLSSRHSLWATAMIDEPFAQMDKTSRRAAAKQLIQLLEHSAFKQVFVISHSQETTDMYPSRINIVVAKDGSRRINVA